MGKEKNPFRAVPLYTNTNYGPFDSAGAVGSFIKRHVDHFRWERGSGVSDFFSLFIPVFPPLPPPPSIARSYVLFFGKRVRSQPAITRLALDTSRVNGWQNRLKCALWVKQSARPDFAFQ